MKGTDLHDTMGKVGKVRMNGGYPSNDKNYRLV